MVCIENTDKDPEQCNINFGELFAISKLFVQNFCRVITRFDQIVLAVLGAESSQTVPRHSSFFVRVLLSIDHVDL